MLLLDMAARILGVIPSRYSSSRFPGKALALLAGKPTIQHVFEQASRARKLCGVIIATDTESIQEAARSFGAPVVMTRSDHPSGTDRAAEVAERHDAEWIVNIQGDEPMIDPAAIDAAAMAMLADPQTPMGTLKKRIQKTTELEDPNIVKVVTDLSGYAIYFSRFAIPYQRGDAGQATPHFKHIGLYVYRRDFLLRYPSLPVGPLELSEKLEQLRAMENGYRIRVVETDYESVGIDTPEDLEYANQLFRDRCARS